MFFKITMVIGLLAITSNSYGVFDTKKKQEQERDPACMDYCITIPFNAFVMYFFNNKEEEDEKTQSFGNSNSNKPSLTENTDLCRSEYVRKIIKKRNAKKLREIGLVQTTEDLAGSASDFLRATQNLNDN